MPLGAVGRPAGTGGRVSGAVRAGTYAQDVVRERSASWTELDYPKGLRVGGHPPPDHPESQHLPKHLADLWAGNKIAAGAKDGV